jgi:hypothetical protein
LVKTGVLSAFLCGFYRFGLLGFELAWFRDGLTHFCVISGHCVNLTGPFIVLFDRMSNSSSVSVLLFAII